MEWNGMERNGTYLSNVVVPTWEVDGELRGFGSLLNDVDGTVLAAAIVGVLDVIPCHLKPPNIAIISR